VRSLILTPVHLPQSSLAYGLISYIAVAFKLNKLTSLIHVNLDSFSVYSNFLGKLFVYDL
jgi:hypothetical protein